VDVVYLKGIRRTCARCREVRSQVSRGLCRAISSFEK